MPLQAAPSRPDAVLICLAWAQLGPQQAQCKEATGDRYVVKHWLRRAAIAVAAADATAVV